MTKFAKVTAMTAALIMCGAVNAATITLDGTNLTIEDAWKIANNEADVAIAPKAMKLLEDSYKLVLRSAASGQQVYGLTVGVGLNKDQKLFTADGKLTDAVIKASRAFNYNALRSHSAAVGKMMPTNLARLSMVVRLNTLLTGKSGAQPRVAELYRDFLNKGVTPLIPSEGSIGEADILMASHVGAVMIGEWKAEVKGKVVDGKTALKRAGITPLVPEGKDALAILSNNSVAVAYAIEAARNAARVIQLTPTVYGLSLEGLNGNVAPILPQTVGQRPFEGLAQTAIPIIVLPLIISTLMRFIQGSGTVAMTTAASISAPIIIASGVNPTLGAIACCAGSLFFSYFNDSYFWVVNRTLGVSEAKDQLQVWSVTSTIAWAIGVVEVLVLSFFM